MVNSREGAGVEQDDSKDRAHRRPRPSSSEPHGPTTRWGLRETHAYTLPQPPAAQGTSDTRPPRLSAALQAAGPRTPRLVRSEHHRQLQVCRLRRPRLNDWPAAPELQSGHKPSDPI